MNRYKFLVLFGMLFYSIFVYSFEAVPTASLLESYLENDESLKSVVLDAKKAQLNNESVNLSNGFDITISTGSFTIKNEKDGMTVNIKPSVEASIPQAKNLVLSASTNYKYKSNTSVIEDTKLRASVDILGSSDINRDLTLLKSERNVIEAERKIRTQALETEKKFYTELRNLINTTISISNLQNSLYSNKIDFEKIKVQGYSKLSSTYRLAQMKVTTGEHDIEQQTRTLLHDYLVFYKKCGYEIVPDSNTDIYALVPSDIVDVTPLKIRDFDINSYSELEKVLWNNKISALERETHSVFSLSANGGVTFNNSSTSSTTIDAGLSAKYSGVSFGADINIPIQEGSYPLITLSASISPTSFRQTSITKELDALNIEEENLNYETAKFNYGTTVVDYMQSMEDLLWEQKNNNECYEVYAAVEKDMRTYYRQGLITESEYNSAKTNARAYSLKKILNSIDIIIYNNNLKALFIEDETVDNSVEEKA